MSFLIVTKSCCGLREECGGKKGVGKKAYEKHRSRKSMKYRRKTEGEDGKSAQMN